MPPPIRKCVVATEIHFPAATRRPIEQINQKEFYGFSLLGCLLKFLTWKLDDTLSAANNGQYFGGKFYLVMTVAENCAKNNLNPDFRQTNRLQISYEGKTIELFFFGDPHAPNKKLIQAVYC